MENISKVWHDDPIGSVAQDALGNKHVAERTARLIADAHSWTSSVVFGVTGSWGSGKTSLINMTCEVLKNSDPDWAIAWFTPWATSDTDSLVAEFYNTLSSCIPESTNDRVRKALSTCARTAGPLLRLVPLAGGRIADAATVVDNLLSQQPSWHVAFEEASKELEALHTPVLIVADDVDRLQRDELVALLKVVRLLGRFPGVSYLLAYDEQTLHANLQQADLGVSQDGRARVYMEKIVQYSIAVPPLLPNQMLLRLDAGLTSLFERRATTMPENDSRLAMLAEVLESQLATPRSVDRLLSQFDLVWSMHEVSEINEIDLFLLILTRVQFPDLYAQLRRWRRELTSNRSLANMMRRSDDAPKWDDLLSHVPSGDGRRDARAVLEAVFPAISSTPAGGGSRCRASDKDYFDRYFVHTIPEGDIPDSDISLALEQARSEDGGYDLMERLLTSSYPDKADLALSKLWDASTPVGHGVTPAVSLPLLSAVMSLLTRLEQGRQFFFGRRDRAISWTAHIIHYLPSETNSRDLDSALNYCSDLTLRLHVLWDALKISPEGHDFVVASARRHAQEAMDATLRHLRKRDDADPSTSVLFFLMFVAQHGDLADARDALHKEIPSRFAVEDLAARCVGLAYSTVNKANPTIHEFDQSTFALFAPQTSDPLYDVAEVEPVNEGDVSWANRRTYTRGRARPAESD